MTDIHSPTVVRAFTTLTATDGPRPLLTYYDDATGERTELSAASLANWVAKTANLLVDGHGLGPGDLAALRLPAHWQTAAVLLGCWSAGLTVDLGTAAPPALSGPLSVDVAFVTVDTVDTPAAESYALALAPMGLPFRPGPPPGTQDYVVEVRGYGDHFAGAPVPPESVALTDGTTHADLATAVSRVPAGGRVLVDGDAHPDPRTWLVAPLMVGASVVLCRNLDPAKLESRLASEHATPLP
jgi:uncharacterized protein (TIGR03089 family)